MIVCMFMNLIFNNLSKLRVYEVFLNILIINKR